MAKANVLVTCRSCGDLVSVKRRTPSHALHAIMSVVTVGFWVIIWLAAIFEASVRPGGNRCPKCRGRV